LWNADTLTLSSFEDAPTLNAAFTGQNACAGNLRPGRYAQVQSQTSGGVDFQLYSIHLDSGVKDRDFQHRSEVYDAVPVLERNGESVFQFDGDVVVAGDWNTMGRAEPPAVAAAQEILSMDTTLHPIYRRVTPSPACSEYFDKNPGLLDHFAVSSGMQEAAIGARVTGYCAVHQCNPIAGQMPAAYERLSDHCPVVLDLQDVDLDT
jgi:exonuclease III